MSELLHQLGVDWKLLIAQIINFLVLFFVLKKFLYGPILEVLQKRRAKIEQGLKNAERLEGEMGRVKEAREEILKKASQKADTIIREARDLAESKKADILAQAQEEAERLAKSARESLEREKERVLDEARSDLADLVLLATEKVARIKLDKENDRVFVEEALSAMRK